MTVSVRALTIASATMAAALMLALGILGNLGAYEGAVAAMAQWHLFFDLSAVGIVAGMVEAASVTAVIVAAWGWLYNQIAQPRAQR